MSIEDVVLLTTIREDIRDCTLQVNVCEVPCRVQAVQAVYLIKNDSDDAPSAVLTSEVVEQASSPVSQEQTSEDNDSGDSDSEALVGLVSSFSVQSRDNTNKWVFSGMVRITRAGTARGKSGSEAQGWGGRCAGVGRED